MSRTRKDAPYYVLVARASNGSGRPYHDHTRYVKRVRKHKTDVNGRKLYEEVERTYTFYSHAEYARAIQEPLPLSQIPLLSRPDIPHNKYTWREKEDAAYAIDGYRMTVIKVIATTRVPVEEITTVITSGECTINDPVTRNVYRRPCGYYPLTHEDHYNWRNTKLAKERQKDTNRLNRRKVKKDLTTIANAHGLIAAEDFDYLDYQMKKPHDWLD